MRDSAQQSVGDDLEQGAYVGRVQLALVGDDGDAADQPADLERVDALAERFGVLAQRDNGVKWRRVGQL